MSDILINILLSFLIIGPLLYFVLNRGGKKSVAQLKTLIMENHLELGKYVVLSRQTLAMDASGEFLYNMDNAGTHHDKIALGDVQQVEVVKHTGNGPDGTTIFLKQIDIQFLKKDKTKILWPVFDFQQHGAPGTDLTDIEDFVKIVNQNIIK